MSEDTKSQAKLKDFTGDAIKTKQVWEVWTTCGGTVLIQ